jgi:hypothetical protein
MRRWSRAALLLGAVAAPLFVAAVAIVMLHPFRATELAIATVGEVTATPRLVGFRELAELRGRAGRRPHTGPLPVWLYRQGDRIRAIIALDPRNGCDLELWPPDLSARYSGGSAVFHDVCHGSLYDADGQPVGGPGPFVLDELVLSVRENVVYASTVDVHAGAFVR